MKTTSKTTYAFAAAMLLSLSTSAFADTSLPTTPDMMSVLGRGDFCTTIKTIDTTSLSLPFGKSMPLMEKKLSVLEKISEKFRGKSEKKESKVAQKIDDKSSQLTKKHEQLRSLAKTDAEKAAVEKFITATTAAEATKKAALDPIMSQFKRDMEALITSKSGISADVVAKNKAALETALATAKTACANGTSSADAKKAFKKAIESTVTQFKDFKPSAELRKEMKLLERKNRTAVQTINDTFQDAMDDARDALELAMPNALPNRMSDDKARGEDSDDGDDDKGKGRGRGKSDDRDDDRGGERKRGDN